MTRAGIEAATSSVLAIVQAGHHFGAHHELLAYTSVICRALLATPWIYTDHELKRMVSYTEETRRTLRGQEGKEAAAARQLLGIMRRLVLENIVLRTPTTARPC